MSAYQSRYKRPPSDDDVTHTVTRRAPIGIVDSRPTATPPAVAQDWTAARKAKPVNYMLPLSVAWLRSLPSEVRPMALALRYPRIANLLAVEWGNPTACEAYFDGLMADHRPLKRQGFPVNVQRDLRKLRDYYQRQHLRLAE